MKETTIRILIELRKNTLYVRDLIKRVKGSSNLIINRLKILKENGYVTHYNIKNKKYYQLTEHGLNVACKLEYFINPGQPNEREKWILALLWGIGEKKEDKSIFGNIRLQKLLFLLQNDEQFLLKTIPYNFYPYKYGPFDHDILEDTRNLEFKMLIRIHVFNSKNGIGSYIYKPTLRGSDIALKTYYSFSKEIRQKINQLRVFNKMNFKDLMRYVYSVFPEYRSRADYSFIKSIGLEKDFQYQ